MHRLKSSFKQFGNYKINKTIIRVSLLFCILFIIGVFLEVGVKGYAYTECTSNNYCLNPFVDKYGNCFYSQEQQQNNDRYKEVCKSHIIQSGTSLGEKPPIFALYSFQITMGIFILGLLLNHLIYNRGIKWNKQELQHIQNGLKEHFKISMKEVLKYKEYFLNSFSKKKK